MSNPCVQPDPTQPMWIGLGWTYIMNWVGSKNPINPTWIGLSQKTLSTRPLTAFTCEKRIAQRHSLLYQANEEIGPYHFSSPRVNDLNDCKPRKSVGRSKGLSLFLYNYKHRIRSDRICFFKDIIQQNTNSKIFKFTV